MRSVKRFLALAVIAVLAVVMCRYAYRREETKRYAGFETAQVVYVIDGDTLIVKILSEEGGTDGQSAASAGGGQTEGAAAGSGQTADGGETASPGQKPSQPHVRLLGIDCEESVSKIPEKNTEKGREASKFTKSLAEGKTVYLQKDETNEDRYGRLLRYVWLEAPDDAGDIEEVRTKMLDGILLDQGMAREMNIPPDTLYADIFHEITEKRLEQNES